MSKQYSRLCPACAEPVFSWCPEESAWICEFCDFIEVEKGE
jgi:hypothetical protein